MEQLMNSRLFLLLAETSQDKNLITELKLAYGEFALKLLDRLNTGENLTELYCNLGFASLELADLCNNLSDRQGEKCPYYCKQSNSLNQN